MALVITATVGSATANSFVTVAEMTAYCEGRLNASIWTAAAAQEPALVEATRDLSVLGWRGSRVDDVQALPWPRDYVPDPDAPWDAVLGETGLPEYATTEIPQRVKDATCELALQYLKAGTTDLAVPDATAGVVRKKVGPLETEWGDPGTRLTAGPARFTRVWSLVAPLLKAGVGGLTVSRV